MTSDLEPVGWDFRYEHTNGSVRYGITPPVPAEGWTKQRRQILGTPWEPDPDPWPTRVKLDFRLQAAEVVDFAPFPRMETEEAPELPQQ